MKGRLIILTYHHIDKIYFYNHIRLLKIWTKLVNIYEGLNIINKQNNKVVSITFDDAYEEVYFYAFPILKRMGISATLFVPTDFIDTEKIFWWDYVTLAINETKEKIFKWKGVWYSIDTLYKRSQVSKTIRKCLLKEVPKKRVELIHELKEALKINNLTLPLKYRVMNWNQIAEMQASGIEIGSHSMTHENLTMLPSKTLIKELYFSKKTIERTLNCSVKGIAYPFGGESYFNDYICSLASKVGYKYAVTTVPGINYQYTNKFKLHRYFIGPKENPLVIWAIVNGLWPYFRLIKHVYNKVRNRRRLT